MYLKNRELRDLKVYHIKTKEQVTSLRLALLKTETVLKIINEMFKYEYDRDLISEIHMQEDIAKIHIICPYYDDIYTLEESLKQHIHINSKQDYILSPKDNGYRALHLLLEIPIYLQKTNYLTKIELCLQTTGMYEQTRYATMR